MTSDGNRLGSALAARRVAIGVAWHLSEPDLLEIIGLAGYDWVSMVLEHATLSLGQVAILQRAADLHDLTTLAHVSRPDDDRIVPLLNLGIGGVVCPGVSTPEEARQLVATTRFPPLGNRSAHGSVRAAKYGGTTYEAYVHGADRNVLVGVGLESKEAVAAADRILDVEGISVVFVGLLDLTHSLGVPGEFAHRDVREAVSTVAAVARQRGVTLAMSEYGFSAEELVKMGAGMVMSPPSDLGFLRRAFESHLTAVRQSVADPVPGVSVMEGGR